MRATLVVLGILLIALGGFSLAGGGVSWPQEETVMDLGPIEATAETRRTFAIPTVPAAGMLLVGVGALAWGMTRKE